MNTITPYLLIVAIGLGGCNRPAETSLLVLFLDSTPKGTNCSCLGSGTFAETFAMLRIDTNAIETDALKIQVHAVTGNPLSVDTTLLHEAAGNYLVRTDATRIRETRQFIADSRNYVRRAACIPGDTTRTWLYEPLMKALTEVAADRGYTTTQFLIMSDGLENGNPRQGDVSFYNYRNPKDHQDWTALADNHDTIAARLEKLYDPVPSLIGIDVTLLYPTQIDPYALRAGVEFMRRFIEDRGGRFTARSAPTCPTVR